jgi:hypothetical protein
VSPRRPEPHPHYRLSWTAPDRNDVVALAAEQSADVAAAALAAATDVEFGRRRGNALGDRKVTGDLSGLYRVKFDVPDHRPERFRSVYRHVRAELVEILIVGKRDAQCRSGRRTGSTDKRRPTTRTGY